MASAGETIPAMPARDVTFANDDLAFGKTFHVIADAIDHADELVPDGHRDGDRFLGPGIPVIYMYVRPADGGFEHPNEDIVSADFRHGHVLEPESRLGFCLHDCLHRLLHDSRLAAAMRLS